MEQDAVSRLPSKQVWRLSALLGLFALASCGDAATTLPPDPIPPEPPLLAECRSGMANQYPCNGVDLVSKLEMHQIGAESTVSDLWGWTDPATGTEWTLVGHSSGTSFVGLLDPRKPFYAGVLPMTEGASSSVWRDIKVYRDHAFIVSDGAGPHGMQVFDLTQLRSVSNAPATFTASAHYDNVASAHNIVINEETGFAYVVGSNSGGETCGGGLHMIDVRAPGNPVFAGCFSDPNTGFSQTGYTHDAMCVVYNGPDAEYRGRELCFGANETALSIADVSDKESPTPISATRYPLSGYTHQVWLDAAHEYLYMNDEFDEFDAFSQTRTLVWDIKELGDPILAAEFLGATPATDHNLYIRGDLLYQSNYRAGLRILNIEDRENPREVAYFDVEPADDLPGFEGTWSNYPFFASRIIPVTSMGGGVLFLRLSGN
ncbi:MAG: choice-of-anchor B family protein [Gemmatimonadetes bacterium]|nr:choice-of-anchor B family protein [Gemmatimonadota bacterium]